MREQGYGQWQTMLYEPVVRAVVVRFIAAHQGVAAAQKEIDAQNQSGFVTTAALSAVLQDYERSCSQFRTFEDVMPRIVAAFREAAR